MRASRHAVGVEMYESLRWRPFFKIEAYLPISCMGPPVPPAPCFNSKVGGPPF